MTDGYVTLKCIDVIQMCLRAIQNIETYRLSKIEETKKYAVKQYTKRWVRKDRTPKESFEYYKAVEADNWFFVVNAYDRHLNLIYQALKAANRMVLCNLGEEILLSTSTLNIISRWDPVEK